MLCRIMLDAATMHCFLKLKDNDMVVAMGAFRETKLLCSNLSLLGDGERVLNPGAQLGHLPWWMYHESYHLQYLMELEGLCNGEVGPRPSISWGGAAGPELDLEDIIAGFESALAARPNCQYIAHDRNLAVSLRQGMKVRLMLRKHESRWTNGGQSSVLAESSTAGFPPRVLNFRLPPHIVRPSIEGWTVSSQKSEVPEDAGLWDPDDEEEEEEED